MRAGLTSLLLQLGRAVTTAVTLTGLRGRLPRRGREGHEDDAVGVTEKRQDNQGLKKRAQTCNSMEL